MSDEANLNLLVGLFEKLHQPKEEGTSQILLHGSHASGDIHHGEDDSIRLKFHIPFQCPIPQVFREKGNERFGFLRETALPEDLFCTEQIALREGESFTAILFRLTGLPHQFSDEGRCPLDRLLKGSFLVQMGDDARFFYAFEPPSFGNFRFRQGFLFEVRKTEILEHHLDQFFDVDFRFEKIDARLVTGLSGASVWSRLTSDNITRFPVSLTDPPTTRTLLFMNKTVGLEASNRNLYDLSLLTSNDGGVADNFSDVLLDGLFDLLASDDAPHL